MKSLIAYCPQFVPSTLLYLYRPLHLCIDTWNVAVVKRWAEIASREDIEEAINLPGEHGTALCMAASLKRDHESGR